MAAFATVAELESWMGVGSGSLGARGTAILEHASAEIRLYVDQDLDVVTGRQESFAGEWNQYVIRVTQVPVTALTLTVDAVAYTDFFANYVTGDLYRNDGYPWDEGPIIVTYDSGWAADSDELLGVKAICLDMATRVLSPGPSEQFGLEFPEVRGQAGVLGLYPSERSKLDKLRQMGVG